MTWRKLKVILFRWLIWSIKRSLQRPAQNRNRLLPLLSVLFRFLPHLQWPTTDDSLKPRWRRQTTPLRRRLLEFDPGNRRPNRMIRWDQTGRHGPRWPVTFVRLRSAELWMRRTWSPTSRRWWARRTTPCLRRATWRMSAPRMLVSWMACPTSEGWSAQGNLRPTLSLLATRHWHWWTWLTDLPQLVATLENTLSRSLIFSLQADKRFGTTSSGVEGFWTSSKGLNTPLSVCSGGEPHARQLWLFPTQETTFLAITGSFNVSG